MEYEDDNRFEESKDFLGEKDKGDASDAGRPDPSPEKSLELGELAAEIGKEYRLHQESLDAAKEYAAASRTHRLRMAVMLVAARERATAENRPWGKWVEDNLPFGERQAQRYVRLGRRYLADPTRVSADATSLRAQLREIGSPVEPSGADTEKPAAGPDSEPRSESDTEAVIRDGEEREALEVVRQIRNEHEARYSVGRVRRFLEHGFGRVKRQEETEQRINSLPPVESTGLKDIDIRHCEFQDLSLESRSVDLILTDPPYDEKSLPLWDDLGQFALRVLKPTGLLVAYTGNLFMEQQKDRIKDHVPWFWQVIVEHNEKQTDHVSGFQMDYKAVHIFRALRSRIASGSSPSILKGHGGDKTYHPHGQPLEEAEWLIEGLTEKNDLVVDPFCGGGTVPVAAMKLGRRCIAAEKEEKWRRVAMARIHEEKRFRRREFRIPAAAPSPPLTAERKLAIARETLAKAGWSAVVVCPSHLSG